MENIQWCLDELEKKYGRKTEKLRAARREFNKLKATNGWRSVKDELPKVGVNVLVYRIFKRFAIAHISNSNSWYDYNRPIEYEVTHWIPLPAKPKL